MHISDLMDQDLLAQHVEDGLVSAKRNPDDNLTIYNYSRDAQITGSWDDVTRNCRGLIVDDDGKIIARPLPKFFNYCETDKYAEEITPDTPVTAYDKLDGSLGIVYWDKSGKVNVATRGSFTSVMAEHATELIRKMHIPHFEHITMLVEIIYPENQIVIDYKGVDDLFLLGGVDIETGDFISPVDILAEIYAVYPNGGFKYLAQDYSEIKTVQDGLDNLNRANREGFVLHTENGTLIKLKQDDYLHRHKMVFSTSKRSVWYSLARDILDRMGNKADRSIPGRMTLYLDRIKESLTGEEFTASIEDSLPSNLVGAAKKTRAEMVKEIEDISEDVIQFVDEYQGRGCGRGDVYHEAVRILGRDVSGAATDLVFTAPDDEDRLDRLLNKMVLSILMNILPAKGDRLTEELNEEDE